MYVIIMLVWIGIISGILAGITGIQYGILVPVLLLTGIIPSIKTAIGTVLYAFIPPVTAMSVYYLYKQGHVDIKKGNLLMITVSLSMLVGAQLSTYLTDRTIRWITAWLMLGISLFFFHMNLKTMP
jgi:uncharacterized membrane protein YfcA